jgi:di/tricarboxylate transporter
VLIDDADRFFQEQNVSRSLVEVVVSPHCPFVSQTIKQARFRTHYNAAIVAVARHGMHIHQKIGSIRLAVGDTLLLDAPDNFVDQQRYSKDFLLVSSVENSQSMRHQQSYTALAILLGMIALVTMQVLPLLPAAMLAAGLMLITGCTTGGIARKSIDWTVLIVIGASIGLGVAVEKTGLGQLVAEFLILSELDSLRWVLMKLFLVTALATSLLSNTTAAVLLFPVAMAASESMGVNPAPFLVTLIMGASSSFATPIGYQTNLMVFGPGGYRFIDYIRAGLPMVALIGFISVTLIPWIWSA